ncbi:helicase associated domain-containing protein [Streptomyces bacillaris]|uniref:helicase associated domain-containing protein n=1 Tax=Streptomyces bacillaris TaxID=68179 RepID=UPI0036AC8C64
MIWSVQDAAFWRTITTAHRAFELYGILAVPQSLVIDGVRIGQALANLRRLGGLGSNPERAAERREALEAIDPDWNPAWPADWQRAYAAAHTLLAEEQGRTEIVPGITVNGVDVGAWTAEQTTPAIWDNLLPEQQTRLQALGLKPTAPTSPEPTKKSGAFELGITALTQYAQREGHLRIPRQHTETVVADDGQEHQVKAGIFLSNHKSRRAKLSSEKRGAFAVLGLDWAQETTV